MIDASAISEGIAQFGIMLLLVVRVVFLIVGPYILYVAFKETQKAAARAVMDEDMGYGCGLLVLLLLYAGNLYGLARLVLAKLGVQI